MEIFSVKGVTLKTGLRSFKVIKMVPFGEDSSNKFGGQLRHSIMEMTA